MNECKGCKSHERRQMRIHKKIVDMNCGAERVCKQLNKELRNSRRKHPKNSPKWDSKTFLPEEGGNGYNES